MSKINIPDEALNTIGGGIKQDKTYKTVNPYSSCQNGFAAALGGGQAKQCGNCFYYHPTKTGGYCSHPIEGQRSSKI